jgi:hypothetical protein
VILKDAWTTFLEAFREQRAIERKRRKFEELSRKNLNYTLIEEIVAAASKQAPGFYSILKFPDGTAWEFGKKEKPLRKDGETY